MARDSSSYRSEQQRVIQMSSNQNMNGQLKYPEWHFLKIRDRGIRNVDPAEGIHFEKLPPLGAVIRESAQNSLDAQDGDGPVHMRISVHNGTRAMSRSTANQYLKSLFKHLQAAGKMPHIADGQDMSYVVIEDFSTHGLVGDPTVFFDTGEMESNRFYWFHRNTNRTQVQKKRGGSFGYGKASFALASKVHSFFTVSRASDNSVKVFGNSIAKGHDIDGSHYQPYGDFGFEDEDEIDGTGILPSQDTQFFEQICSDFELERGEENGLSVIIPFPEKDYSSSEIIESMIRNYFLPICEGKLTVEVNDGHSVMIDSQSIREVTKRMDWNGDVAGAMTATTRQCMIGMVELANWWAQGQEAVDLETCGTSAPHWHRSLIKEGTYDTLRNRLESGQPLALRAALPITKKIDNGRSERYPETSEFFILIRKQDSSQPPDSVWIRRYLSVPKTHVKISPGFIAIMISADGVLEELLRESEEVAHTEHRHSRIEKNYKHGGAIIRFFRQSASNLIQYLQENKNELEIDWLDEWFPSEEVELDEPKKPKKKRKKRKKKVEDDIEDDDDDIIVGPAPPPEDLSRHHSWDLQKTRGGFTIFGDLTHELDCVFRVSIGYARDDGGDPVKKWKAFDFDLAKGDIQFELEKATLEKAEANILVFRVEGPIEDYSVDVTGFDTKRDLHVYARPTMVRKEEIE
jgi:hypothetical protein